MLHESENVDITKIARSMTPKSALSRMTTGLAVANGVRNISRLDSFFIESEEAPWTIHINNFHTTDTLLLWKMKDIHYYDDDYEHMEHIYSYFVCAKSMSFLFFK